MAIERLGNDAIGTLAVPETAAVPLARGVPILAPVAILVALSALLLWFDVDRSVAGWFFASGGEWVHAGHPLVRLLYDFGTWPAMMATVLALAALVTSPFVVAVRRHRRLAVYLVLVMMFGPGLLVNVMFKDHAGRARPREVVEFGGEQPFRPLGEVNLGGHGKSFPSGHASMGFFWMALFIYWYHTCRRRAWWFLAFGLVHGGLMGIGRVAQGAHWCSDVLWSAGLTYGVAWWVLLLMPVRSGTGVQARPLPASVSAAGSRSRGDGVSIVVPFFNEVDNVEFVLRELKQALPEAEVVAVDDGSDDGTWTILGSVEGVRAIRFPVNQGQSAAIYHGLHACRRPIVGIMDGDGQNDPASFPVLLDALERSGVDVACGYRARREDRWSRRAASRIANRIRRLFLRDGVRDTGCSMKVFRREAVELLVPFRGLHRYLPAIFRQAGLQMVEVPVNHRPRRAGASKYSNWSRALVGIYDLVGVGWLLNRLIIPPERESAS